MDNPNSLITEKSPYLLQHAYNPVEWFAWKDEAFQKARKENKPIFLSIGYSTCHWCHVMEKESFENEAVAKILNEYFVPIKVDREERPDIDAIYMSFVQMTTGSGGWPLSVWLTPSLKPFYGGTYFPIENKYGKIGFFELLKRIHLYWNAEREKIEQQSNEVITHIEHLQHQHSSAHEVTRDVFDKAANYFTSSFDTAYGGFSSAPKFPTPSIERFLLRYVMQTNDEVSKSQLLFTLKKIQAGGICDHIHSATQGGGFFRYSTDSKWLLPHFEKMLYDNAQLTLLYTEAYLVFNDHSFKETAENILKYLSTILLSADGGFFSAEDADSFPTHDSIEKKEGAFYGWSEEELRHVLTQEEFNICSYVWNIHSEGNVDTDAHGEFSSQNIIHQFHSIGSASEKFERSETDLQTILHSAKEKLYLYRETKPRPSIDDKILCSWNALAISAFAKAGMHLDNATYINIAKRCADFILEKCYDSNEKKLYRRYRDNEAAIDGVLDDYAFLSESFIHLYEATFDEVYLQRTIAIVSTMIELFYDTTNGGFFHSQKKNVLVQLKEFYDGVDPSGNSVAVSVLLQLWNITGDEKYYLIAQKTIQAFSNVLNTTPYASPYMLIALYRYLYPNQKIVLATSSESDEIFFAMKKEIAKQIRLTTNVVLVSEWIKSQDDLMRHIPIDKPSARICRNFVCELPIYSIDELRKSLVNG